MPEFIFRFRVNASVQRVSEFHGDTRVLKRLTPPPVIMTVQHVEPLAEGSEARFTMWLGPIPIRWRAVHRDVSSDGFTDVQAEGPAASWKHTHSFAEVEDGVTEVHEHIQFAHKSGWRGMLTRVLFSRPSLYLLFTYRKLVTRWHCRSESSA